MLDLSIETVLKQSDECYKYHLKAYKDSLVEMPWGPTAEDIAGCLATTYNASGRSTIQHPTDQPLEDSVSDEEEVLSEVDEELLMAVKDMELAEEYHTGQADEEEFIEDDEWLEDIENGYLPSSPVQRPLKRHRH
ncbi:hypothetical protein J3A83DRAFT_4184574 [Scleroderma citrinum]